MEDDLITRLIKTVRKCSPDRRKAAAMELARTETIEAVNELIRMVEGCSRTWFSAYDFYDQLIGIEALGETNSGEALCYLRDMYTPTTRSIETGFVQTYSPQGSDLPSWDSEAATTFYEFRGASGDLKRALSYEEHTKFEYDIKGMGEYTKSPGECTSTKDCEIHGLITASIAKLQGFRDR